MPIHNYFGTIQIEVVNQNARGVFYEKQEQNILAKFEIRGPDIHSLADSNGRIWLPLDEFLDYKRMGMKQVPSNNS